MSSVVKRRQIPEANNNPKGKLGTKNGKTGTKKSLGSR